MPLTQRFHPRRVALAEVAALEALRAHPSPRVQNNVADRLRAAARSHPALIAETCARWLEESPVAPTRRIVRRAMRRPRDGRTW